MAGDQNGLDAREMMMTSGRFMGHGVAWALAVLLFSAAGGWLDSKLSTAPLLMIVGAFAGGGAGLYSFYYHTVIEPREREDEPQ